MKRVTISCLASVLNFSTEIKNRSPYRVGPNWVLSKFITLSPWITNLACTKKRRYEFIIVFILWNLCYGGRTGLVIRVFFAYINLSVRPYREEHFPHQITFSFSWIFDYFSSWNWVHFQLAEEMEHMSPLTTGWIGQFIGMRLWLGWASG
jgi:hypothetical protein